MLTNYFITALNNLIKNKLYSAINIVGLAVGLAASILILLYVQNEISYDKHWSNAERIYTINQSVEFTVGEPQKGDNTSVLMVPALKQYFPNEIEYATRMLTGRQNFRVENDLFEVKVSGVDKDFSNIFDLEVIAGDLETVLSEASSVALREDTAKILFGNQSPIGQTITMELAGFSADLQVGAIYKKTSYNTVIDIPAISPLQEQNLDALGMNNWLSQSTYSYIKLHENVSANDMQEQMPAFIDRVMNINALDITSDTRVSERIQLELQNIANIYLNSMDMLTLESRGNRTIVLAFSMLALLIVMIASINFIVLTTARATQRAQEVALRKVHGAKRWQLVVQFLGESFLLVLFSMFFALALAELIIPFFEIAVGENLEINYAEPYTWLTLLALLIVVGFLGGLYPSLILSGFRPAASLKANHSVETSGTALFKNVMVVFQFGVSVTLIIATIVIYTQIQYSSNRDPGFSRDGVIILNDLFGRNNVSEKKAVLEEQLAKLPSIQETGSSVRAPMGSGYDFGAFARIDGEQRFEPVTLHNEIVGAGFIEAYEIPIIAGRSFDENRDSRFMITDDYKFVIEDNTPTSNIIVNESAARELGFNDAQQALNAALEIDIDPRDPNNASTVVYIVGVVKDIQYKSLHEPPVPMAYFLSGNYSNYLSLRFNGNPRGVLEEVEKVWQEVMGNEIFKAEFLDQVLAAEFEQERVEGMILVCFSLLAVTIACMGLFGSAAFNAARRTREVGLRKVMGAKVKNIVGLLLWQFTIPVLIANMIAWPIAIIAMSDWLQRFAYQIDTLWLLPICLLAGVLSLLVAWVTVASNTIQVARSNPINALRYE